MPVGTRYQARHKSILTVHGPKPKGGAVKSVDSKVDPNDPDIMALKDFIKNEGVATFITQLFGGGISLKKRGLVSRDRVLSLMHHDGGFRNVISNAWRQENDHHHEWIPCTYLTEIIRKGIVSADFRYIQLANVMRTPTGDIIFEPVMSKTITPPGNPQYAILQAHPGGLKFHAPAGDPLGKVPLGHDVAVDNKAQTEGQIQFHTAIVKALEKASSPTDMVGKLSTLFDSSCWDGNIPSRGGVTNVWPYYYRSGGTVNLSTGVGAIAPISWPTVTATYARVRAQFNAWDGVATAKKPIKFKL